MEEKTVAIVGRRPDAIALEREIFAEAGIQVATVPHPPDASGLPETILAADGILQSGSWPVTPAVLDQLRRCRVVGRYGLGFDNIDVDAATARGIAVVVARGYCEEEISDHALAFMLAWHRRIIAFDRAGRRGAPVEMLPHPIPRIARLTLGLCGMGGIARCLARKGLALGMQVIAHDPFVPAAVFEAHSTRQVGFDELLSQSDVLSIHCALNPATHHLFDRAALQVMKPSALLINTARGGIVDTAALAEALRSGVIAGACLDVWEPDVIETCRLREIDALLLTPHMAWQSDAARVDLARLTAVNVRDVLLGRRPAGLVNPDVAETLGLTS